MNGKNAESIEAHTGGADNRRRFLTRGAVVAAAAVAGVALSEQPAAAANGDDIHIGQNNAGTASTGLTGSQLVLTNGNGNKGLTVNHNGSGATAVTATASGSNGEGLHAYGTGSGGRGLFASGQSQGGRFESHAVNSLTLEAVNFGSGSSSRAFRAYAVAGPAIEASAPAGPGLRLTPGPAMPPGSGVWEQGDVVAHDGLWFCVVPGTGPSSKWVKLSSVFVPLAAPKRIYDSRPGQVPAGVTKGKITTGQERVIDAGWDGAIPDIATAVQVNLTVTETSTAGYLSLFKNGIAWPGTSSINWAAPNTTIANGTTVAIDTNDLFKVRAQGDTHFVIDVLGYYT